MPVTPTPIFPQTIKTIAKRIITSDSTNLVTLFTAGANGAVVRNLQVCSDDSSARTFQLWQTFGGVDVLIGTISISSNSGANGSIAPVSITNHANMLPLPFDANGNRVLEMEAGAVLKGKVTSAMSATRIMHIIGAAGDY
jgi:hypothetical protein